MGNSTLRPPKSSQFGVLQKGLDLQQAGRLDEAEREYRRILDLHPGHVDTLHLLGVAALENGKPQEAVESLGRAVRRKPDRGLLHHHLGEAHFKLHQLNDAVECYRRALELDPENSKTHNNLGWAFYRQHKYDEAIECFRRALEFDTELVEAQLNLGNTYLVQLDYDEAVACYRQAIQMAPQRAGAHASLGRALAEQEKFDEAIECLEKALELDPESADAHAGMGTVLCNQKKLEEGIAWYHKALAIDPDCVVAHMNLGTACMELQEHHDARTHCQRTLELEPNNLIALTNLMVIEQDLGDNQRAMELANRALELNPLTGKAYLTKSAAKKYTNDDQEEIDRIEELLKRDDLKDAQRDPMHFALGKIYDDLGEYDRAWPHFQAGNELVETEFDEKEIHLVFKMLLDTFNPSFLESRARFGSPDERPIFVVGMPRSGTTLTEQILASHPQIHGVGERKEIAEITRKLRERLGSDWAYPGCVPEMSPQIARELGDEYVCQVTKHAGDAKHVVDKMPANFNHLGLISVILPKAKIIHCRRHPLNSCLSCYFKRFNKEMAFAFDLQHLGIYYRRYERLMDYWQKVLPLPIFQLDYETMVEDQEGTSRKLLEFCGLDWDPSCLEFYRHSRGKTVRTASNWQVRQPIYKTSLARWKRYEKYLGPLKEALGWSEDEDGE